MVNMGMGPKPEVVKPKKRGPKHRKGGYETTILKKGLSFALPEEQSDIDRVT